MTSTPCAPTAAAGRLSRTNAAPARPPASFCGEVSDSSARVEQISDRSTAMGHNHAVAMLMPTMTIRSRSEKNDIANAQAATPTVSASPAEHQCIDAAIAA